MFHIEVDKEVDIAYVTFNHNKAESTEEITNDIIVNIDKDGNPVGLEIMNFSYHGSQKEND
ncbi:DUF2283 domain-containing protein [Candidatus Daviesbacteria bacterium]|nr:DUF2283 domain-containing protein [Candidatus Daviesbacteria bacterium]